MQHLSPTLQITTLDTRNLRGVTLIELLVAMVILGIIVTSVYTAFNSSRDSWQVGEVMMQRYQNARGALDMMAREISAMYFTISNIYETGLIYDGTSGSTSFRFVARIPENSGAWDLCKVGYRYDGTDEIERGFDVDPNLTNLDIAAGNWQPRVSNINELAFRWWNGTSWNEGTWDSMDSGISSQYRRLPRAIEIMITAQDEKQIAAAQSFYTVVYLPGSKQNE